LLLWDRSKQIAIVHCPSSFYSFHLFPTSKKKNQYISIEKDERDLLPIAACPRTCWARPPFLDALALFESTWCPALSTDSLTLRVFGWV
jgi:hypothetical protein